jgi:hypothetical protein
MRMKLIGIVLVGLLVMVVAVGCGGSSKKASSGTTNQTTTSQTTTSTSTSGGLNLSNKDCANLVAAASTISNAESGKLPSDIAAEIAALQSLSKTAPKSVQGDIQTLLGAAKVLEGLGLKPGQTKLTAAQSAELVQKLSKMNTAKLAKAAQDLGTWAAKVCSS